jgi:hypothetical protein
VQPAQTIICRHPVKRDAGIAALSSEVTTGFAQTSKQGI